jgi:N-acetylglucosamine-6-sulfatase
VRLRPVHLALAAISLAPAAGCGDGDAPNKPNLVVVMTDDQDVASVSVMKAVDRRLAAHGVTFTRSFVTTPECCPSRASFLTGQYAHNHGVVSGSPPEGGYQALDNANTLPVWLGGGGYHTAYFGRYLNGYGNPDQGGDPLEVPPGWEEWHAPVNHTEFQMYDYTLNENGRLRDYGSLARDYSTDLLSRRVSRFVEVVSEEEDPFFLMVAPLAPHSEGVLDGDPTATRNPRPAPRDLGAFEARPVPEPPSFAEADLSDKPRPTRKRARATQERLGDQLIAEYHGRLESLLAVDRLVARLVNVLRETGELQDTVVVFTSDNGYLLGEHRLTGKDFPYEESARVPLIVRGPGFPPGVERDGAVANIDLAPTILEIAGEEAGLAMDGISLLPLVRGEAASERDLLIEYLIGGRRYAADPYQLENLAEDPAHAQVRQRLQTRLAGLRDCTAADCR